jgi:hypothetical protein
MKLFYFWAAFAHALTQEEKDDIGERFKESFTSNFDKMIKFCTKSVRKRRTRTFINEVIIKLTNNIK